MVNNPLAFSLSIVAERVYVIILKTICFLSFFFFFFLKCVSTFTWVPLFMCYLHDANERVCPCS